MNNKNRVRPLVTLELKSDGSVAACLPDFSVIRLTPGQCQAIQQMVRPYLTSDEIAGFVLAQQLRLPVDESKAS
ncbi:hypothetical protein [Ktedonospora formicarum]|uniref:Uncharacterized protein n=1 Tax=Ktedonospora formicarum TaxID=2778364 RepID=A0A8J3MXK7_9CHLR|nr:hypothetical protein [Ktedonospora formicarum]GHO51495.1 hypothetical protein KSX_96580 [Ktedonospora formicarum]GHO51520.1 hypothetical protein KSX_96830 [Ktedonospora formicarum]